MLRGQGEQRGEETACSGWWAGAGLGPNLALQQKRLDAAGGAEVGDEHGARSAMVQHRYRRRLPTAQLAAPLASPDWAAAPAGGRHLKRAVIATVASAAAPNPNLPAAGGREEGRSRREHGRAGGGQRLLLQTTTTPPHCLRTLPPALVPTRQ